jgi:hypothetical protein
MSPSEPMPEQIELVIVPIPPDTLASVQAELEQEIEAALRESGHEDLLTSGQIQVEVEETFPINEVIIVGLMLLSDIAVEVFKATVIPRLKKRFEVKQRSKTSSPKRASR